MTLIFEIAVGIVLAVVILYAAIFFIAWVANWSATTKVIVGAILLFLLVAAYNAMFPNRKTSSASNMAMPLETRAHFAARYKKANPQTVNIPDEELVKRVLDEYPEWCPKIEGGCS